MAKEFYAVAGPRAFGEGGVGVMDIAIDSQGNAFATDYGHELSKLDLTTERDPIN